MGKLLFIFIQAQGHLNVLKSVAKLLLHKYPEHQVYFAVENEEYFEKVTNECSLFKAVMIDKLDKPNPRKSKEFQEKFVLNFFRTGIIRYRHAIDPVSKYQDYFIMSQKNIEKLIEQIKPDLILLDMLFNVPFVENKGIPFGYIVSTNPLYAQDSPKYPPAMSGLSSDLNKDGHLFNEYRAQRKYSEMFEKRKNWFSKNGLKPKSNNWIFQGSDYLNLMVYPKQLEYNFQENEVPGKWFSANSAILPVEIEDKFKSLDENRNSTTIKYPGKELLTEEFLNKPGKLILFSLGTVVSHHEKVFDQLLKIIGSIPHKFIVNHDKANLPDNCTGSSFLDQKELYPLVDVVITHGGNNTICELMHYHRKPFICIAHFADQYDNMARIKDLNLGISITLDNLGSLSLLDAIDRVTSDLEMRKRMKKASKIDEQNNGLCKFVDEMNYYLTKQKV